MKLKKRRQLKRLKQRERLKQRLLFLKRKEMRFKSRETQRL